jgi:MEDS: MEthanogen/methylotroph, DcmR Sensory domain
MASSASKHADRWSARADPVADWPAHGDTARLRRQPVHMVEGRAEGGYRDLFELVCPSCGDHPYLDYSQVSPRLQRLRGPRTLTAGLAAYEEHLAQSTGYRHEALLYSGADEFRTATVSFARRAVRAGDPILIMVSGPKIDMLRRELGADAEKVSFADMAEVGRNPGRIIAAWHAFAQAQAGAAQLCGIGEPIYPGRSPAEMAECQLHEALLNVAFGASTPLWLLCPYDLEALTADVIDEAWRTHPLVAHGEDRQQSSMYRPVDLADPFARPLPAPPPEADDLIVRPGDLARVGTFVARHAQQAGLSQESTTALMVAVKQLTASSERNAGGEGELHAWSDGQALVCEISDHSRLTWPLAGRLPPGVGAGAGAGPGDDLWLANQLCDLVQLHSSPGRATIRLHQYV